MGSVKLNCTAVSCMSSILPQTVTYKKRVVFIDLNNTSTLVVITITNLLSLLYNIFHPSCDTHSLKKLECETIRLQ